MTDLTDELVEKAARELANEICGCSTKAQHARDVKLLMAFAERVIAAEREKWMPIESAPKDGTLILAWFDGVGAGEPVVVRYVDAEKWCWAPPEMSLGKYNREYITHWRPIPPGPIADTIRKGD